MSNGGIASSQSLKKKTSLFKIQILVVDDDSTSLAIVSSMLKKCSLQDCMIDLSVVTVKNSLDALSNLRVQNGAFDLVITDLHMPVMNGLELQKQVKEEFKIPVIIMSADDKEKVILKSLESEAAFYMKKPVNPEDLKIVWQYAVASKKGKKVVMEQEIGSGQEETSSNDKLHHISSSSENEESGPKKKKGRKRVRDQGQEERDAAPAPAVAAPAPAPAPPKKVKVIWTNTLHDLFLQAVSHIGLEKAVPKKILEFMNVPGLTRENVASHLQKYRMFLKKVAEKGFWTSRSLAERAFRSSFAIGYTSMYQNPHKQFSPFLGQQPSFQPGYGGNLSGFRSSSSGLSRFPSQEAPTSNSVPQLHYGQSSLFGNPTSFQQRSLVFANPCLANRSTSNNIGINLSSDTATQHGLTIGATPMQMQQQQNQANPQSNIIDNPFTLLSTGIGCSSMATSNYAGIILTSDGELIGTGKTRFNGIDLSSGSNNGGKVLMNMTHDNSMNNPPTGNGIFGGLCAQGAGSSSTVLGSTSQFSPTFIATNQENTLMLPPQSQQHTSTGLRNASGENDLMTNASTLGTISDNHQQELGEVDLDELLFGSPYTTPYQDQNSEVSMNVNLHSSPYQAEVGGPVNEFLNSEFSTLCTIADQTPWSEKSSAQLQGREETVNPDFGGNVNPLEDYYPSFEQPQCNNLEHTLNGMDLDEAPISGNEVWGDDILNFLLGDEVY